MDKYLRRLQRLAVDDPEAKERYIRELERSLGLRGTPQEEHPYFQEANIASVWIKDNPALEREIINNLDNLGAYRLLDVGGNGIGFLIDVYWEENYDEEDFEQLGINLSEEANKLFDDAAMRGYSMLAFFV